MIVALIILIVVMALSSVVVLTMAVCEFILSIRQSRQVNSGEMDEAAISAPAEEKPVFCSEDPFCAVEDLNSSEGENTDDANVSFEVNDSQRLTLQEAYAELSENEKAYFDKIVEASRELPFARIIESTYAYTVMQGRDTIARLRILRGIVTLDCTVVNADLIKYNKENGKKIRNKPVRFRVESEEDLDAAVYTMQVANGAALSTRNVRKKATDKNDESVENANEELFENTSAAEEPVEEEVTAEEVTAEEVVAEDVVAEEAPADAAEEVVNPVAEAVAKEAEPTPVPEEEKKNSYVDGPIIVELGELVIDEGNE